MQKFMRDFGRSASASPTARRTSTARCRRRRRPPTPARRRLDAAEAAALRRTGGAPVSFNPARPRLARAVPDPRRHRHAAGARRGVLQGPGSHRARRPRGRGLARRRRSRRSSCTASSARARPGHRCSATMLIADQTGYVLSALFAVITALTALMSPAHQREHDWQIGEYYGVLLLSASGMVMLAHAGEPRDGLPRHRDDVDRRLRDGGDAPPLAPRQRSRDEVLPDRRVRDRLPASTAWRCSTARRARCRCSRMQGALAADREPGPRDRGRVPARRRVRLQDRRGAVPHVGARCVRRRADAGDRVHGRGASRPRRSPR